MTIDQRKQFKEFLELSNLDPKIKEILTQPIRPEARLSLIKELINNYYPAPDEQETLVEILAPELGGISQSQINVKDIDKNNFTSVKTPTDLPDPSNILAIYEPYLEMSIITPNDFTGKVIELINTARGEVLAMNSLSLGQIQIVASIPLGEVIIDFYDQLKSGTKGYASMSYSVSQYKKSNLVKVDVLLNGKLIEPLSTISHKANSEALSRKICTKLKELIPRQQVEVAIQAVIGSRVIARETVKPFRKDVTAKLYGGDVSRRMKLLDKQKEGKKRMKQFANVNIPNDVFLNVLKND
ncbi:MAG: hypothetical protein H7230_00695 [Candidatus Parcubacteria bacterium]|nr:hypothetical protein [Candidatus Paceibacterota bacterium]